MRDVEMGELRQAFAVCARERTEAREAAAVARRELDAALDLIERLRVHPELRRSDWPEGYEDVAAVAFLTRHGRVAA